MTKLRWARPQERSAIQNYLFEKMGKIPHERWANILDCRWNALDDNYGVVVEENGQISGFLGIVFADRQVAGAPVRTGNITSWYLEKHLRGGGLGQEMVDFVCQPRGVTYTATSANFRSGALLKKIGWDLMEDKRLFWHRHGSPPATGGVTIRTGDQIRASDLPDAARQIIHDHRGLNLTPHLLRDKAGRQLFFITYMKLKGEHGTRHYEILHANDLDLLSVNIADIAEIVLPRSNALLSCDRRFIAAGTRADETADLEICRYFKPWHGLPACHIDFLYGEVLLLDLKIY